MLKDTNPGDGAPDTTQWPELDRDIMKVDRKTQLSTGESEAGVAVLERHGVPRSSFR